VGPAFSACRFLRAECQAPSGNGRRRCASPKPRHRPPPPLKMLLPRTVTTLERSIPCFAAACPHRYSPTEPHRYGASPEQRARTRHVFRHQPRRMPGFRRAAPHHIQTPAPDAQRPHAAGHVAGCQYAHIHSVAAPPREDTVRQRYEVRRFSSSVTVRRSPATQTGAMWSHAGKEEVIARRLPTARHASAPTTPYRPAVSLREDWEEPFLRNHAGHHVSASRPTIPAS